MPFKCYAIDCNLAVGNAMHTAIMMVAVICSSTMAFPIRILSACHAHTLTPEMAGSSRVQLAGMEVDGEVSPPRWPNPYRLPACSPLLHHLV